ncbi:MAG: aminopeptidase P family protein [Nitrospinota bacterium]|nr:aminopeptidase P family protein [Nitrospinota bacterium]
MILEDPGQAAPYMRQRRKAAAALADWSCYDALMVTDIKNIRYLSGFSGTTATMLLTQDQAWFITDFRYMEQAAEQTRDLSIQQARDGLEGVAAILSQQGIKSVAYEAEHVPVASLEKMESKLAGVKLSGAVGVVEGARMIKDEAELETIRRLVDMLGELMDQARGLIRPGVEEREIAIELERAIRLKGADGPAFEFIVASGKRGALPHGVASSKIVKADEAVTLDWGARGWGYNSDNTRTFLQTGTDKEITEIYKITLEANQAAMEAVRPGVKLSHVDQVARDIITRAGYGEQFGHGTGHGVGLDVHEAPRVNGSSMEEARPGMVFTIEPGIYLPGKGGVRIEDMVYVTETGVVNLSQGIPKSLESARLG